MQHCFVLTAANTRSDKSNLSGGEYFHLKSVKVAYYIYFSVPFFILIIPKTGLTQVELLLFIFLKNIYLETFNIHDFFHSFSISLNYFYTVRVNP